METGLTLEPTNHNYTWRAKKYKWYLGHSRSKTSIRDSLKCMQDLDKIHVTMQHSLLLLLIGCNHASTIFENVLVLKLGRTNERCRISTPRGEKRWSICPPFAVVSEIIEVEKMYRCVVAVVVGGTNSVVFWLPRMTCGTFSLSLSLFLFSLSFPALVTAREFEKLLQSNRPHHTSKNKL